MSKGKSVFRCTECGADQPKWGGKCDACGAWNSLIEEAVGRLSGSAARAGLPTAKPPIRLSELKTDTLGRWRTGLAEFDFVLGGGIVPGSVTLVGGEPGIGKSTLLMQCAARLESQGIATLYVSGEESPDQLRLRADRHPAHNVTANIPLRISCSIQPYRSRTITICSRRGDQCAPLCLPPRCSIQCVATDARIQFVFRTVATVESASQP